MKKILSMIIAFALMIGLANAQTVEHSRFFENTYVTVVGGATTTGQFSDVPTPFFWNGAKGVYNGFRPFIGVELGKYITPVVGLSLEGLAFYGTTTSQTFIDESAVLANGKINFSNWFGGYKGQPRRVEVVGVLGLGWGHDYVNGNTQTWASIPANGKELVFGTNPYNSNSVIFTDKNYIVYNAAVELNINLGKSRAWQINVRPGVMWFSKHMKSNFQSLPRFMSDARTNIQVGFTYKFGSKRKNSHNFVLCPYTVTAAERDALVNRVAELESRKPEVVEVVKTQIDTIYIDKTVVNNKFSTIITFEIGSSELTKREKAKLGVFARVLDENEKVNIVGSADTKTGSLKFNENLSEKRAMVVKDALVELGVSADRITTSAALDTNEEPTASRAAVLTVTE